MKLPSISYVAQQSLRTIRRFPMAIFCAAIATVAAIVILNHMQQEYDPVLLRILLASILGISFYTALALIAEERNTGTTIYLTVQTGGMVLLVLYAIALPEDLRSAPLIHLYRYFFFLSGMHFLVAIVPLFAGHQRFDFWQYNKTLFLRILTSLLYTGVLFVGLLVALLALKNLFDIDIPEKRYAQLWATITGVFNTWFFLSGVPEPSPSAPESTEYPKALKIFTQYILLPLVAVYLLILYAYGTKILLTWTWPLGWVSQLVLGFSVTGILALLLIYPIKDRIEMTWIRSLWKWYFIFLLPLDALLLLAIWRRISEYGFTESRYLVLGLGVWLTAISLYFTISRKKSIRVIPASLCLLAILAPVGPWSAFSVSENSQMDRLTGVLSKNGILVNKKIVRSVSDIPLSESREITSIVEYIVTVHGTASLQSWFSAPIDSTEPVTGKKNMNGITRSILASMGVQYIAPTIPAEEGWYIFTSFPAVQMEVTGFDHCLILKRKSDTERPPVYRLGGEEYEIQTDSLSASIVLAARQGSNDTLVIPLSPMIRKLINRFGRGSLSWNIPDSLMTADAIPGKHPGRFIASRIRATASRDSIRLLDCTGTLLVGWRTTE